MRVTILNVGGNIDYLYGLVRGLAGVDDLKLEIVDCYRSDLIFDDLKNVRVFNFLGDSRETASVPYKILRQICFYARFMVYITTTRSDIFHIQWVSKFEILDRLLLVPFYRVLGKALVFTAHNVDANERVDRSSRIHKWSLRFMYSKMDAIIAHAHDSARRLTESFGVPPDRVSVIRHGINNKLQFIGLPKGVARASLNLGPDDRVLLAFGNIEPYKGIEYLVEAVSLLPADCSVKVVVAGRGSNKKYLNRLRSLAAERGVARSFVWHPGFVPDREVETYFAAADCVVLPYRRIFQSGVIFLAYRFGMPVIATAVGGLKEDVLEGRTGLLCEPDNPLSLARTIENYFKDVKWAHRERIREAIISYTATAYSWDSIAVQTLAVYRRITQCASTRDTERGPSRGQTLAAIMIQDPTEMPMNASDKSSPASWRRAAGNTAEIENQETQEGLTDSCSELD